ncbi:MAG: acyl-ACP thioesterase domain-containing protein [Rikenellaceae bacterium]
MDNTNYLDHSFTVNSVDIDLWGYMKPSAILNICQDVAYVHSAKRGLGFDTLISLNMAWVLSRVKVSIEHLPAWHEQIRVRTWHKRQSGPFSLRDYILYDADEQPIIRVTTSWLIINLESRRISRVDKVLNHNGALTLAEYQHDAIETEAHRIVSPTQSRPVAEHKVLYSDLDINGHVNNSKYIEWACDHTPQQMQQELRLKSLCVNFNHEAKYNDLVSLSSSAHSSDNIILEGSIHDKSIFIVELEYAHK